MGSFTSRLRPLQRQVVELLGNVPSGYFSGGTVLSGYLAHRGSLVVDLFVAEATDVAQAAGTLLHHASESGWAVEEDGEPFEEKMKRLVAQLSDQFVEGAKLEAQIRENLRRLGYGE